VAVNVDGALGCVWELERWNCETIEPDAAGQRAARLAAAFRRLREGAVAQFLLRVDSRPDWSAYLEHGSGLLKDMARSKARALEASGRLRRYTLYFTLKWRPEPPAPPWAWLAVSPRRFEERVRKLYEAEKASFLEQARSVESSLASLGLRPRPLGLEEVRSRLFRSLNPDRSGPPPLQPSPLREQVLYTNARFDPDTGSIGLGSTLFSVVSVIELPPETRAGMLAAAWETLPEADWIFNIDSPSAQEVERFLKSKKRLAFCQQRGQDYQADIASIKGEIDSLLTQMVLSGTRILGSRIHAIVSAPNEGELNERTHRVLNDLQSAGFAAVREGPLALTLFLQSLPLAYDPANDRSLKRARRMQDINLAHLAPVYRSCEGTRRADLLFLSRSGEPVTFSFFDGDLAPHGIVCGISGSGKSVLSNHIILEGLRRGSKVFVLDRGGSYRKLAELCDGQTISLDPARPLCVNPLGGERTQEQAIFETDFLSELLTAGRWDLGTRERSLLAQALRRAHDGTSSMGISELLPHLDPDLAVSMRLFARGGPYGEYFDGPCGLDPRRPLTVFELEDAALNKEISSGLLMSIIHRITRACREEPGAEKLLIVDEAWTLLKSPGTARFLENVFRTFRKHRTCAIMVSQQVSDFEGAAGEAIRANAPHRFFLRQTPETLKTMERILDLKPREKEVLSTLATVKGEYSEMLLVSPLSSGVVRLLQDPMTYWLTTSDPADNELLSGLRAKHPLRQALQLASMRHPRGAARD
jgi:conjugal transfer ATP-binding protein TraC